MKNREYAPLTDLECAILQTVAYADVFDYPITHAELHRYLIGKRASPQAIAQALAASSLCHHHLADCEGYLTLTGRTNTIHLRRGRSALAQQLWPVARHYGLLIAQLPFVRMVAVTGSLAVDNVNKGADIDYLIVTAPGRLWLARLFIIALVKYVQQQGYTLCPNYLISENALHITEQNLFTARELCQMVPLSGMGIYAQMRRLNPWTDTYFPNAQAAPQPHAHPPTAAARLRQRAGELLFRTPLGGWLDRWEMRRKIRKLKRDAAGAPEADYSADFCKGHIDGHMRRVMSRYDERLRRFGIEAQSPVFSLHSTQVGQ